MSLRDGLTPKMKPVSPRRAAIVAALDIGTSKAVCLIARLKPQSPQETLRRRSHGNQERRGHESSDRREADRRNSCLNLSKVRSDIASLILRMVSR